MLTRTSEESNSVRSKAFLASGADEGPERRNLGSLRVSKGSPLKQGTRHLKLQTIFEDNRHGLIEEHRHSGGLDSCALAASHCSSQMPSSAT